MEYQKAVAILKNLLDRHSLNAEEKEAVMTAIGVLVWGSLSKSKIKAQKAKRDKSTEWQHHLKYSVCTHGRADILMFVQCE